MLEHYVKAARREMSLSMVGSACTSHGQRLLRQAFSDGRSSPAVALCQALVMFAGLADEERARVVTAAHTLLAEENAAPTFTIDALAARAGVARAQVQRRFGTPTRVLEALWDQLLSDHCLALLPNAFQREEPTAVLAELIAIYGRCWHGQ